MAGKGFIVAATSSGCGKTTFSLGLMRALSRRGVSVQPFKCGPDYIDTQFHGCAAGRNSINLDVFMSSEEHVRELYAAYSDRKDVSVIEGVMGMFDGYSKMEGSSAGLSRLLGLPVILLVNAASTAYSVAPVIYGFKHFQSGIKIAGVVFNRVSSESHFACLKEACEDAGVECLGFIRKNDALSTPSRHLGLTLRARVEMESFINAAADAVEADVDIDRLSDIAGLPDSARIGDCGYAASGKVVAVASDEAFNFIYQANLDRFRKMGYEIAFFSPLSDSRLPDADVVYLPGGYPELFKESLAVNDSMKESVRSYVGNGGKLWAECGGMIYLAREIDGSPMCGVLPLRCTMADAKLSLGYRKVDLGYVAFMGHEFHYSKVVDDGGLKSVALQTNARGKAVSTPVYRHKNAFASYTHLYWGDNDLMKLWQR